MSSNIWQRDETIIVEIRLEAFMSMVLFFAKKQLLHVMARVKVDNQ